MQDYPAAHSMDTDWFAIDAEGNVGIFSSGENGAVPNTIHSDVYLEDFLLQFPQDNQGIVHLAIDGKIAAAEAYFDSFWYEIYYGNTMWDLLLVLSSEAAIEELLPYVRLQFSGADTVVYVEACSTQKVKSMFESGKIIGGKADLNLFKNTHIIGIFPYKCDSYGIPEPYKRLGTPIQPLKLDDFPVELRSQINQVSFDSIRFSETKEIQPIEHMRCQTWGNIPSWVDTEGQQRYGWQNINLDDDELE